MNFDQEIEDIKSALKLTKLEIIIEGGCRFLFLHQFFRTKDGEPLDCLFSCDPHLGYQNRLWFPRDLRASIKQNWNGDAVIVGKRWFAYSMQPKGVTLLEKLLSIYMGVK